MMDLTLVIVFMTGLSAMMKYYLPDKYVPLLNFFVGIAVGYFYIDVASMKENLLYGALIGLGVGGFVEMAKLPIKNFMKR